MYRYEVQMLLNDGGEAVMVAVPFYSPNARIKLRVVRTHISALLPNGLEPVESSEQDFYDPDDTWYTFP